MIVQERSHSPGVAACWCVCPSLSAAVRYAPAQTVCPCWPRPPTRRHLRQSPALPPQDTGPLDQGRVCLTVALAALALAVLLALAHLVPFGGMRAFDQAWGELCLLLAFLGCLDCPDAGPNVLELPVCGRSERRSVEACSAALRELPPQARFDPTSAQLAPDHHRLGGPHPADRLADCHTSITATCRCRANLRAAPIAASSDGHSAEWPALT